MTQQPSRRPAFMLIEVIVLVVLVAAVSAALALTSADSRRRARLAGSIANLQQFAAGTASYAADNDERVWSYSWRAGINYGFGGVAPNDNQAAANQAVDIMRRRGNRTDLQPISGWIPHILYNHLPLLDYLSLQLPAKWVVSPEDTLRLSWQADPLNAGSLPPFYAYFSARFSYSSSYEIGPAFISPDAQVSTPDGPIPTVAQDPTGHRFYQVGSARTRLGTRRMTEVAFPAEKAMLYEQVQRSYSQRQVYFMYDEARVPVMLADGSAGIRSMATANLGYFPNSPLSPLPARVNYAPELSVEPPTLNGAAQQFVLGRIRWTRSGLRGRDFAGPEIPWVP